MASSSSGEKKWHGSAVVIDETAQCLGWVKTVRESLDNGNELTIVTVPSRFVWLPKSMTGFCEFSGNAVLTAGDSCLVIAEDTDIETTLQSELSMKIVQAAKRAFRAIAVTLAVLLALPLAPVLAVFLAVWAIYSVYRKIFIRSDVREALGYRSQNEDDEGNEGFSRVRQPRSPGPQPPDSVELELPLFASEPGAEAFSITRLL